MSSRSDDGRLACKLLYPSLLFFTVATTMDGCVCVDVVEISSSEEDEDSDLIMMPSDAELEEEDDDDDDGDDVENSGSHVNDALNQRDAMGGVLVNVGHPASETDIFLAPQLASIVKPHQVTTHHHHHHHYHLHSFPFLITGWGTHRGSTAPK